jgi:hypothetical protein
MISLQKTVEVVEPNAARFDLSIASRISDGRMVYTLSVVLHPVRCENAEAVLAASSRPVRVGEEVENVQEQYVGTYAEAKAWTIADLEAYAAENEAVQALLDALGPAIDAINAQEQII